MNNIYKAIALILISLFFAFGITISIVLFANSHRFVPDKWLEVEEKVTAFFERITLPIKIARLSWLPADEEILMPVYGIRVREVTDSWNAPRPDNRLHEGQDIFAARGTPVFSGTSGYVVRMGDGDLGGNFVYVAGNGGARYYYAHFDRIADGLRIGQKVTTDTVLGFVGNTGNAENTPYHLHFGVYRLRKAVDPLPLLVNR